MDKVLNNLIVFRNVLKYKKIYDFQLIGILSQLCFENIIDVEELKMLIVSSYNQTTEVNDITRLYFCLLKKFKINELEKNKENFRKKLYKWICKKIEILKKEKNIKEEENVFNGWIK